MRAVLYFLTVIVTGCHFVFGGPPPGDRPDYLDYQIREIRQRLDAYSDSTGELPARLSTICPGLRGSEACPFWPVADSLLDPWHQPFVYDLVGEEYVIGSIGADGIANTADDVMVRPSAERATVEAVAGCYRLDLTWLSGVASDTILRLEASPVAPYQYRASPRIARYWDPPSWRPIAQDSLIAEWVEIHHAAQLRLAVLGDSLTGVARAAAGAASWWGRPFRTRQVAGGRIQCPDQ